MAARRAAPAAGLAAVLLAAGCAGLGKPGPAEATRENRLSLVARLLEVEDRRDYDPLAVGAASASRDPWVRSRAALAAGRLRDVESVVYLPVLLSDPDPSVRRAAAFASGISGDARLVPMLAKALSDPDAETASEAAAALGRLGGAAAEEALVDVLRAPAGPKAGAALALFRTPGGAVAELGAALSPSDPPLRRAAAYALSRSPGEVSAAALRPLLGDADAEVAAWSARALGLLADGASAAALAALAKGPAPGPAIQALLALDRLGAKGLARDEGRAAGLARARDARPGVAVAALTLLRRSAGDAEAAALLESVARGGGRRGGVALASLAAGEPGRAFALAFPADGPSPVDLRLGAAEALPQLPAGEAGRWLEALLADPAPRVRMEAVSRLPRGAAPQLAALLARALADPDGAVRAAALDAAAPLAEGPSADAAVREAFRAAYAASLASGEPDLVASALDAAASLAEGACPLLAARRDDEDDLVRARARRLLVEKCGEDPARLPFRAVRTRLGKADYARLARLAETGRLVATVETTRGRFEVELLPAESPMTVDSFAALARKGYFDGTTIHRVVPDFVVQAGDPRGDGTGGPGYALRDELNPRPYRRGTVGMALSGPDTGGSQWFVTLSRQPHLDGAYTVFGEATEGMEVVERIEQNDRILSVRVTEGSREAPPGLAPSPR